MESETVNKVLGFNLNKIKMFFHEYKRVNLKPLHRCNLDELYKRDENCRWLVRSFVLGSVVTLIYLLAQYFSGSLEMMAILIFLLCIVMGYDEGRKRENIQLFIFLRKNME